MLLSEQMIVSRFKKPKIAPAIKFVVLIPKCKKRRP